MPESSAGAAFFDFDDTLIHGDSLMPFLARLVGPRRAHLSLARAVNVAAMLHARRRPLGPDLRTSIKAILLRETLAGVPAAEAAAAGERLADWVRWKTPIVDALRAHRDSGRRIVVATGALGLYMPALLRGLGAPVDAVLATEMEVAADGTLTGRIANGNCVRAVKAGRVAAWLAENGPFGATWGYGNRPSDLPMLALLDHRVVV